MARSLTSAQGKTSMPNLIGVFLDSDVVISSLISPTGAANFLTHHEEITCFVSNISLKEIERVSIRLHLTNMKRSIHQRLRIIELEDTDRNIGQRYGAFVLDPGGAHIVAGVSKSGVRFLITYNLKHYKAERLKRELDILVMTPARFLQYLRSR